MKSFTAASNFLHCFILQFLSKIVWSIMWFVCWSIDLCAQFNMVSEPQLEKALLLLRSPTGSSFWAKLLLPELHQKVKVYHLIPQVKELLINLSWSIMLVVMKTWNVHVFWPYDEFLCWLQVFIGSSLHSLQQLHGFFSRSSHLLQLPPIEGGYGYSSPFKRALSGHNEHRIRA